MICGGSERFRNSVKAGETSELSLANVGVCMLSLMQGVILQRPEI